MNKNELFCRWITILRQKASEYEHEARKRGETVCSPSLDEIAWEIEAYEAGTGDC
jgi:hypothetical protein